MPKETFISVGWKEQQKCHKNGEDQRSKSTHSLLLFFLPPFVAELLKKKDLRKRTFSFLSSQPLTKGFAE